MQTISPGFAHNGIRREIRAFQKDIACFIADSAFATAHYASQGQGTAIIGDN